MTSLSHMYENVHGKLTALIKFDKMRVYLQKRGICRKNTDLKKILIKKTTTILFFKLLDFLIDSSVIRYLDGTYEWPSEYEEIKMNPKTHESLRSWDFLGSFQAFTWECLAVSKFIIRMLWITWKLPGFKLYILEVLGFAWEFLSFHLGFS